MNAYSDTLLDHVAEPRRRGPLAGANAVARQTNPVCGDVLDLMLRLENGRIADAGWEGRGCPASLGTNSMVTDKLVGLPLDEARALDREAIDALAGGLPKSKLHCAALAADALREALDAYEHEAG